MSPRGHAVRSACCRARDFHVFADSIACSIIVLALSGLVLWTRLERRRIAGLAVALCSLALAAVSALQSL